MNVYGTMVQRFAYLEVAIQKLSPEPCDIHVATVFSLGEFKFKRPLVTKQVIVPNIIQNLNRKWLIAIQNDGQSHDQPKSKTVCAFSFVCIHSRTQNTPHI